MQELEIEKRYLVPAEQLDELLAQAQTESVVHMNDYYVPNGERHKDLRLRQSGDRRVVTRKRPVKDGDLAIMSETTIELSPEEFEALTAGITTNVEKDRYQISLAGRPGELDVFAGRHAGLAVLEFEFADADALASFESEQRLGLIDITQLEWLAAGRLAETSYVELAPKIQTLTTEQ